MVRSSRHAYARAFRRLDNETLLKVAQAFDVDVTSFSGPAKDPSQIDREGIIGEIVGLKRIRILMLAFAILMLVALVALMIRRAGA